MDLILNGLSWENEARMREGVTIIIANMVAVLHIMMRWYRLI